MRKYILLIGYIIISLIAANEFHPFSKFPMYNSFPNWGYVFHLKNENDESVYYSPNFSHNKNAGYIAHTYYSFFNHHNYYCGSGKEEPAHLKEAGRELMNMILKDEDVSKFHFDSLILYRRFYYLENEQLTYKDDLMYEQAVK
jgi:hypothetical protein